jgi:hypothetical protein
LQDLNLQGGIYGITPGMQTVQVVPEGKAGRATDARNSGKSHSRTVHHDERESFQVLGIADAVAPCVGRILLEPVVGSATEQISHVRDDITL